MSLLRSLALKSWSQWGSCGDPDDHPDRVPGLHQINQYGRSEEVEAEEDEEEEEGHAEASSSAKLPAADMAVFGQCPMNDDLRLVSCNVCHLLIKIEALASHMIRRHSADPELSPPERTLPLSEDPAPPPDSPCDDQVEEEDEEVMLLQPELRLKLGKREPDSPPDSILCAKQAKMMAEMESPPDCAMMMMMPMEHHGPGRSRAVIRRTTYPDFDPDKHCGVLIELEKRQCTRSLTCSLHSMVLKRRVSGRSHSFDQLLRAYRGSKGCCLQPAATKEAAVASATTTSSSPASFSIHHQYSVSTLPWSPAVSTVQEEEEEEASLSACLTTLDSPFIIIRVKRLDQIRVIEAADLASLLRGNRLTCHPP